MSRLGVQGRDAAQPRERRENPALCPGKGQPAGWATPGHRDRPPWKSPAGTAGKGAERGENVGEREAAAKPV